MTKVMILSLKERFLQSIVAMILFIKVMIALHTMIIYIICKKTNWCTFSRSYPTLRTFLLLFLRGATGIALSRRRLSLDRYKCSRREMKRAQELKPDLAFFLDLCYTVYNE